MIEYENLGKVNAPFFDALEERFRATLRSGWYILGKEVQGFEEEFAAYCGTRYCVGVASGLDALILSLRALELQPGDEVLVPSNTYIATILAIVENGLTPVLVEPNIRSYNIDPGKMAEAITPRTKAALIVHLYGQVCEMGPVTELCRRHGIHLIEDCAQSHGARYQGAMAGSFGIAGAYSFYPTKNLGALGDAGAVTTNDTTMYERLRKLRNYGSSVKYINEIQGVNSRLDEVQAAFLRLKLGSLDGIIAHKKRIASIYLNGLKKDYILPALADHCDHVYHIFNIRHPRRDALRQYLSGQGIGTEIHYPVPPHRQEAMRGILPDCPFPISEEIHATTLSLPISSFHTERDIETVIGALNAF